MVVKLHGPRFFEPDSFFPHWNPCKNPITDDLRFLVNSSKIAWGSAALKLPLQFKPASPLRLVPQPPPLRPMPMHPLAATLLVLMGAYEVYSNWRDSKTPAIDKPPEGKSVAWWIDDMKKFELIAAEISTLQQQIRLMDEWGLGVLNYESKERLESLFAQAQIIVHDTNTPITSGALKMVASAATSNALNSSSSTTSKKIEENEVSALLNGERAPIRFDALKRLAQTRPDAFTSHHIERLIQLAAPGFYHSVEVSTILRRLLIHHCDALQGDLLVRAIDTAMANVSYAAGNEDDIAEFLLVALDYYPELFEERHLRFFTYSFMRGSARAYLLERAPHLDGGDRPMPTPHIVALQRVGPISDLIAAVAKDAQAASALFENAKRHLGLFTNAHIHALLDAYRTNLDVADTLEFLANSFSGIFSEEDVRVLEDLSHTHGTALRILATLLEKEPDFLNKMLQRVERKSVLTTLIAVAKLNPKAFNSTIMSALIQNLIALKSPYGVLPLLRALACRPSGFQTIHVTALVALIGKTGDKDSWRVVAATVLYDLACNKSDLFAANHIDPMVDVAAHSNPQYYVNQTLAKIALRRRDLFSAAQVKRIREKNFNGGLQETVDILARNPMPRQDSPRAVVRAPSVLPDFSFGTQPVAATAPTPTPTPNPSPISMLTPKEAQDNMARLINIAPGHVDSFLGQIVDIGVDGQVQIAGVQRIQAMVTTSAQKAELDSYLTAMARYGNTRAQKLLERFPFLVRDGGGLELD